MLPHIKSLTFKSINMQLETDLLLRYGSIAKKIRKNTIIFFENDAAHSFYQILEGTVKMTYTNEYGKELTLGFFEKGRSFGEYSLFIDQNYPISAIAQTDCVIFKLSKEKFFLMLKENPTIQVNALKAFATQIYNKIAFSKNSINHKGEYRIRDLFDSFKKENNCPCGKLLIPYTRQEIADFTGLRVETVIRIVSKMNKLKEIELKNHKIYY